MESTLWRSTLVLPEVVECTTCLCLRRARGRLGERWHIPRVVRCEAHALVCLVVHQVTDGLAGVTVGYAYCLYGVAGLVLLPHG